MPKINGVRRTRRPIGHRDEPDGEEPKTKSQTFLYKEDADAAGKKLDGWRARTQFVGHWDRWAVAARRVSWPSGREVWLQKDGSLGELDESQS